MHKKKKTSADYRRNNEAVMWLAGKRWVRQSESLANTLHVLLVWVFSFKLLFLTSSPTKRKKKGETSSPALSAAEVVKNKCRICFVQRSLRGGKNPWIHMPPRQHWPADASAFKRNPLFLVPYPNFPACLLLSLPQPASPLSASVSCPSPTEMPTDGPFGSGTSNPTWKEQLE